MTIINCDCPLSIEQKNNIKSPIEVIIFSVTSVYKSEAAWAWVASDNEGQIVKQKSARIQEQNISSYQAEAIGILYAIKFIKEHQDNIENGHYIVIIKH
jgi:hypothetical protein